MPASTKVFPVYSRSVMPETPRWKRSIGATPTSSKKRRCAMVEACAIAGVDGVIQAPETVTSVS
jgi:hypothetical protein